MACCIYSDGDSNFEVIIGHTCSDKDDHDSDSNTV